MLDDWEIFIVSRRLSMLCSPVAVVFLCPGLEVTSSQKSRLQAEVGVFTEQCTSEGDDVWQSIWELKGGRGEGGGGVGGREDMLHATVAIESQYVRSACSKPLEISIHYSRRKRVYRL